MSKISKEGFDQIQVIKAAPDSMFDKLDTIVYTKVKPTKNDDVNYKKTNVFGKVKDEFEAIAGIVDQTKTWTEVK